MLHASEDEKANIVRYFLSQSSSDSRVDFLQKVYAETLMGHRHDVWDLHTSEGRWWVITNPTNLYSQDQFPNMDLAVTFHMGLCLRIPRTRQQRIESRRVLPFGEVFNRLREATDALHQAHNVADYQAIGVRSREALLAYVAAAQDASEWPVEQPPKR
ncbi:gamma-glutamylcyclotransferase, partial [Rhizobium leguminosarum]|nr:gamma-glutamylcyclotransferase [Rhizobium leguminosarum]